MTDYSQRAGSPYDRGGADRYYGRDFKPHYYLNWNGRAEVRVEKADMTADEIAAYTAGWDEETGTKY